MNEKALTALKGSIKHWEDNLGKAKNGQYIELGPLACYLCREFQKVDGCNGCPVQEKTGQSYCKNTPYKQVYWARYNGVDLIDKVKDELDFLKSLLPKESEMSFYVEIPCEEVSEMLQKVAFKHGYSWKSGSRDIKPLDRILKFWSDKQISCGNKYLSNLSKKTIDEALQELLKKDKKDTTIRIGLYTGIIKDNELKVECQTFSMKDVESVLTSMKKCQHRDFCVDTPCEEISSMLFSIAVTNGFKCSPPKHDRYAFFSLLDLFCCSLSSSNANPVINIENAIQLLKSVKVKVGDYYGLIKQNGAILKVHLDADTTITVKYEELQNILKQMKG